MQTFFSKNKGWKITSVVAACVLVLFGAVYIYFEQAINEGEAGKLNQEIVGSTVKDVSYILVCGIDKDEEDEGRSGLGLTDLVMLVCYNRVENTATILQIPRDSYVGQEVPTGGTGKINAVYAHGAEETNRISNLAKVINEQFKLPVDYYLTIDMKAFREIIDILGGIEMYVPWDVPVFNEAGEETSVIAQGTHKIDGATAEIIVRSRKSYAQGDIKRLEMQQYFYAAIFRTYKTFPLSDVVKVIPSFITYVNTDMSIPTLVDLAMGIQKLDSSRIGVIQCPGGALDATDGYTGLFGINKEALADLLNTHMRPSMEKVPAEDLSLPAGLTYPYGETEQEIKMMQDLPSE